MWQVRTEMLECGRAQKCRLLAGDVPLKYEDVLALWSGDSSFREFFCSRLVDAPFPAYRWETPPVTSVSAARDFEFVLLRCDALERPADREAFSRQFDHAAQVVTFPNLGGDAVLVVPCPRADDSAYGHLGAFLRQAPEAQCHELWKAVGTAMQQRLGKQPVWLSTAGLGVAWLHVRLDARPKYYGHAPYRLEGA